MYPHMHAHTHICIWIYTYLFVLRASVYGGEGMTPKDGKPFTCQFALDQIQAGHSPAGEEGKHGVTQGMIYWG